jgi:hypothetical protein
MTMTFEWCDTGLRMLSLVSRGRLERADVRESNYSSCMAAVVPLAELAAANTGIKL